MHSRSGRVSRVGERVLAIARFPCAFESSSLSKLTRETRVLPRHSRTHEGCLDC
jgi:hypothetical protein